MEAQYPCSKCGQLFPSSQIHAHYASCKGPQQPNIPSPFPQQQLTPPQWPAPQIQPVPYQAYPPQPQPQYQNPYQRPYRPQPQYVPQHQHLWIENDSFKWCSDPLCQDKHRALKLKWRGTWFLFVRYGLKLFWIQMLISLAIAFAVFSAYHPSH